MIIQNPGLVDTRHDTKEPVDEKPAIDAETVSVTDSENGDEALELVGKERTQQFSEEYNRRLRRKLVRDMYAV